MYFFQKILSFQKNGVNLHQNLIMQKKEAIFFEKINIFDSLTFGFYKRKKIQHESSLHYRYRHNHSELCGSKLAEKKV